MWLLFFFGHGNTYVLLTNFKYTITALLHLVIMLYIGSSGLIFLAELKLCTL